MSFFSTLVWAIGMTSCFVHRWIPLLYADYAHRRGAVLTLMAEDLQTQLGAMHAILDSRVSRSKVMKVSLFFLL